MGVGPEDLTVVGGRRYRERHWTERGTGLSHQEWMVTGEASMRVQGRDCSNMIWRLACGGDGSNGVGLMADSRQVLYQRL